jgi:hypothetical protein
MVVTTIQYEEKRKPDRDAIKWGLFRGLILGITIQINRNHL